MSLDKWWLSEEASRNQTEDISKMFRDAVVFGEGRIHISEEGIKHVPYEPFFGLDRDVPAHRFSEHFMPKTKWYQRIKWLQWLARKIIVD